MLNIIEKEFDEKMQSPLDESDKLYKTGKE